METHSLLIPVSGPIHVFETSLTDAQAWKFMEVLDPDIAGNQMRFDVFLEGLPIFGLLFAMNPQGNINIRAGRTVFDLSGCLAPTVTGPAVFRGITEYAAAQTVRALSI